MARKTDPRLTQQLITYGAQIQAIANGSYIYKDSSGNLVAGSGGGWSGTVTDVSIVSANGLAGTVATSTTTPAITLTTTVNGIVKGDWTAFSAAEAGTDYLAPAAIGVTVQGYSANTTLLGNSTTGTGNIVLAGSPTLTGTVTADTIQTSGSSGVVIKNSGGTTVATFGSAATTNVSFAGATTTSSLLVTGASGVSLGSASSVVGKEVYYNGTNSNTVTIQSGTTSASYTLTLPTAVASAGQVLTDAAGNGVLSWTTVGASWGSTVTYSSGGGTGVTYAASNGAVGGVAVTVANSTGAPTNGWFYVVVGNTQAAAHTAYYANLWTASQAHIGFRVDMPMASTSARGLRIDPSTTGTGYGISFEKSGASGFRGIYWNSSIVSSLGVSTSYGIYQNSVTSSSSSGSNWYWFYQGTLNISNTNNNAYGIYQNLGTDNSWTSYWLYQNQLSNSSWVAYGWYVANTGNATNGVNGKYFSLNNAQSGALQARTNDASEVLFSRTYTGTGTVTDNFNLTYWKRTNIANNAAATYTAQGSVMSLENVATNTASTSFSDSVSVLKLTQSNNSTGGHILFNSYSGSPTTDGVFWFDGTNFKYRAGGATKTITAV